MERVAASQAAAETETTMRVLSTNTCVEEKEENSRDLGLVECDGGYIKLAMNTKWFNTMESPSRMTV
jgi:hypothetical protein